MGTVDVLLFRYDPPDDPDAGCQEILHRYRRVLPPSARAQLLADACRWLVERGKMELARDYFQRAQVAILEVSAGIMPAATREAYLRAASEPLEQAVLQCTDDVPLFLGGPSASSPPARRKTELSLLMLVLAVGMVAVAVGLLLASVTSASPLSFDVVVPWIMGLVLTFAITTVIGLAALLRGEGRWKRVLLGFALSLIACVVAKLVLDRAGDEPPPFHRTRWDGDRNAGKLNVPGPLRPGGRPKKQVE